MGGFKIKCKHCGEEINAIPFKCRHCEGLFCVKCRLPEQHNCKEFNYVNNRNIYQKKRIKSDTNSFSQISPRQKYKRNVSLKKKVSSKLRVPFRYKSAYYRTKRKVTSILSYMFSLILVFSGVMIGLILIEPLDNPVVNAVSSTVF